MRTLSEEAIKFLEARKKDKKMGWFMSFAGDPEKGVEMFNNATDVDAAGPNLAGTSVGEDLSIDYDFDFINEEADDDISFYEAYNTKLLTVKDYDTKIKNAEELIKKLNSQKDQIKAWLEKYPFKNAESKKAESKLDSIDADIADANNRIKKYKEDRRMRVLNDEKVIDDWNNKMIKLLRELIKSDDENSVEHEDIEPSEELKEAFDNLIDYLAAENTNTSIRIELPEKAEKAIHAILPDISNNQYHVKTGITSGGYPMKFGISAVLSVAPGSLERCPAEWQAKFKERDNKLTTTEEVLSLLHCYWDELSPFIKGTKEELSEDAGSDITTFYSGEVGVLIKPEDELFDEYNYVFDHKFGYFDESHVEGLNLGDLKDQVEAYVKNGVKGTYGIITKIDVENFSGIEDVIQDMEEVGFVDDVDLFDGENYKAENVVWSAFKGDDGYIRYNFIEGEEPENPEPVDEKVVKQGTKRSPKHESLTESWGKYKDYDPKDGWTEEDIAKHKEIDWKARNWEDLDVGDEFKGNIYIYRSDKNDVENKEVIFHKFLRANPIYPPYYGPVDFKPRDLVGPMADGRKHGSYDIHDRYEDQKTYNLLSDSLTEDLFDFDQEDHFTPEEQAEYGIEENGDEIDGYDHYVHCQFCGEPTPEFDCVKEIQMGWLCNHCADAIRSRGEKLTITEDKEEEPKEYLSDKVTNVLDDYGILYGDIVDNGNGSVNIVGVDEDEWQEVVDAISAELGLDVLVPDEDHDELDNELIVTESCHKKELKDKEKVITKIKLTAHNNDGETLPFLVAYDLPDDGSGYGPFAFYVNRLNKPVRPAKWEDFEFGDEYILDSDGDDYTESPYEYYTFKDCYISEKEKKQFVDMYNNFEDTDLKESKKYSSDKVLTESKLEKTTFEDTFKAEDKKYAKYISELEDALGAEELYGGNILEIKNIICYMTYNIYKDGVDAEFEFQFDALVDGDFDETDAKGNWIDKKRIRFKLFNDGPAFNGYYTEYGPEVEPKDEVMMDVTCYKGNLAIIELLQEAGYEPTYNGVETLLLDNVDDPYEMDESLKESKKDGLNENKDLKEAIETIKVDSGLEGNKDADILRSILGQLSDGYWENSPRMAIYWKNIDIEEDGNKVYFVIPKYYGPYFGWDSEDYVKKFFADKIKLIAKKALEWDTHNELKWDRNTDYTFNGFFHRYGSDKDPITLKDVYRVYDALLGRKQRIAKENWSLVENIRAKAGKHLKDFYHRLADIFEEYLEQSEDTSDRFAGTIDSLAAENLQSNVDELLSEFFDDGEEVDTFYSNIIEAIIEKQDVFRRWIDKKLSMLVNEAIKPVNKGKITDLKSVDVKDEFWHLRDLKEPKYGTGNLIIDGDKIRPATKEELAGKYSVSIEHANKGDFKSKEELIDFANKIGAEKIMFYFEPGDNYSNEYSFLLSDRDLAKKIKDEHDQAEFAEFDSEGNYHGKTESLKEDYNYDQLKTELESGDWANVDAGLAPSDYDIFEYGPEYSGYEDLVIDAKKVGDKYNVYFYLETENGPVDEPDEEYPTYEFDTFDELKAFIENDYRKTIKEDIIIKPGSTTISQIYRDFDTKQEAIDFIVAENGYGEMNIRYIPKTKKYRVVWEEIVESLEESIEGIDEDIEKHDTLNPKLWDGNELKPEVKEKIDLIVKDFLDGLEEDGIKIKVDDIKLVGSNCSYNYNKDSDLDIHIVADTDSLECPDDLYPLLYSAYRSIWNKNHDVTFYGIPVELYIETSDTVDLNQTENEEPRELEEASKPSALKSNGIYSVLHNKWIKEPVQADIPDLDREAFDKLFNEWEDKYFAVAEKSDVTIDEINDFIEDLYDLRKTSIAKDGEYGLGNLTFKECRALGYLDNLRQLKKEIRDRELSLESLK